MRKEMEMLRKENMTDEALARCIHEVHRAYNVWLEDPGPFMPPWDALTQWQRDTVTNAVRLVRMGVSPEGIHKVWVQRMTDAGWRYGPDKDPLEKTHPSIREWNDLPVWERRKSIVTCRLVYAFTLEEW